jgi:Triose-phosphate Transporter family
MEWILHSKHYSREVKMAVVVVVIGVGVCTVTDVKVNAKGFICACVAVLSTSLQQIVCISIYYIFLFAKLNGYLVSVRKYL